MDNSEVSIEIVEIIRWAEQEIAAGEEGEESTIALEEGEGSPLGGMKIKVTPHHQ